MFFNGIHSGLEESRKAKNRPMAEFLELIFLDDVTFVAAANDPQTLGQYAHHSVTTSESTLGKGCLALRAAKTQNMLLQPNIAPYGTYRRGDRTMPPSTKRRLRGQLTPEAQYSHTTRSELLGFDPYNNETAEGNMDVQQNQFPLPPSG